MEGKDNRYHSKRSKMKQHKKSHFRSKPAVSGNASSGSQVEALRGVIDVADSSDDRFSVRSILDNRWSSRTLESELENDLDNEQMRAGDFGLLSEMPASIGGQFQFSSEKNWDSEDMLLDKTEASEYFTLDLNLLNAGLQTIPFYKRLDFPSSWFKKYQLNAMNQAAEIAEKNYQSILKQHESNPKGRLSSASRKSSARSVRAPSEPKPPQTPGAETNLAGINEQDQELDELLNLTANDVDKMKIETETKGETKISSSPIAKSDVKPEEGEESREGIQQWLDDVLEK